MFFSRGIRNTLYTRTPLLSRAMSVAPTFKPFTLALVQLGGIGSDKNGL